MELRHLRYFVAVAEEEHITRAAKRLGIQQPPLSQQIQQLELELGVTLFDRSPRSIKLNPNGKVFLGDARRVLALAEHATQRVREFAKGKEGTVRVGMTSSSSMHSTTLKLVRAFKAQFPLVHMQVEEGANHDLLVSVEQEHLDIAFVRTSMSRYPQLSHLVLDDEDMVTCLPADSELGGQTHVAISDLARFPFIRYRQVNGSGIWDRLEAICEERGYPVKVADDTQRIMSAIHLVGVGMGVTVVPKSMTGFGNAVIYRPLTAGDSFTVPLAMAFRSGALAQVSQHFINMARGLAVA